MPHTLRRLSKWLGILAVGCYVFLAVAFLGVRYWVLPNIDRWREPLQRELSALLAAEVRLGPITAEWRGRHPRITVRDASLRDDAGRPLLDIPSLDTVLGWRSLFTGRPHFLGLRADGVALSLRRDAHGRVSVLGRDIEDDGAAPADGGADGAVLHWLSEQGNVRFSNATLLWIDELRGAPPLELRNVALAFGMEGGEHVFSIRARPPAALGDSFALQGRLRTRIEPSGALSLNETSGLFHVSVEGMRPAGWHPWMEVHSVLEQGDVDWLGWQEMTDGVPGRHVSRVTVRDGVWRVGRDVFLSATGSELYVAGSWQALHDLWETGEAGDTAEPAAGDAVPASSPIAPGEDAVVSPGAAPDVGSGPPANAPPAARMALRMRGLAADAPELFEAPLRFDDVALAAGVERGPAGGLRLAIDRAQLRNADMDLDLNGGWRQHGGGEAGLADVQGHFRRLELAAIVRYLPSSVDEDAREWMRHGLLAGRLSDAPVRLQGDLEHFPFGEQPDSGDFRLGGTVRGVVIDYAPAAQVGPPGWPRLEQLDGHAELHRVELAIGADSMRMRPGGLPIVLRDVQARIPNIEQDSVLDVQGTGRAEAGAFLALIRETPLARLLDGLFDEARGEGQWEVPISLTIPLMDTDETKVAGSVVFHKGGLSLADAFPPLSHLDGRISFTEEAMAAHALKGRVLGGPVAISGGVGKGQKELVFDGRLDAKALDAFLGGGLDGVMQGAAPYRLALQRSATGAYGMRLDTSLEGLAIGLPEPLSKPAAARWPLRAQWTPASGKDDAVLDIALADGMAAQLRHNEGRKGPSFFHAAAVNLHGKARPGAAGLAVDVQMPRLDIDAWRALAARFEGDGKAESRALLPPLRDLRLQAGQARVLGTDLDRLTFTARRPEGQRWRVDVSSTQTAGTLFWQERQGRIQGEVEAHFQRLALGAPPEEEGGAAKEGNEAKAGEEGEGDGTPLKPDDDIDIPAIRLKVDRLRLYGRDVGAVSLVGVNEAQGRAWKLEQLELSSPHGSLKGSGVWRLDGPRRGLGIQAAVRFDDLGAWLAQAGFADLMQGGVGEVRGHVEWRDIPWRFERAGLQGDLEVDLAKGRLISLGSRSARLLELLSLQSVRRLATLEWNPAGLMRQGFPFDTLQGHIKMQDGVLHSENYRVAGPVGTIVIAGDVDLPREVLDLYAVVVPNLDVSGAAIAAGIAVNPIVGLGAFLTQWLLKDPLGKAMAVEYRIRGDFDDPRVDAVDTSAAKR